MMRRPGDEQGVAGPRDESKYSSVGVSATVDSPIHGGHEQSMLPPDSPLRDNWLSCDGVGTVQQKLVQNIDLSIREKPDKYNRISESNGSDVSIRVIGKDVKKEDSCVEVVSRYIPATPPTLILDNINIGE